MPQVPGIFEACQDPGKVGATVFMEQGVRGARIGPPDTGFRVALGSTARADGAARVSSSCPNRPMPNCFSVALARSRKSARGSCWLDA